MTYLTTYQLAQLFTMLPVLLIGAVGLIAGIVIGVML